MERIYVTVRSRPLSLEESRASPWRISGNSISLANQPTKFDFDRIFGEDCKTVDLYEARTKEIVASAVGGFNGTVFAYGQTNSGKTHTMRGSVSEPGITPLAVHDLFQSMQEDVEREFLVRMSYMEIYNEEINDLLAPEHRKLQIHESLERGIYVAGLREEIVACPEQVLDLMEFGESHRQIGETNMNLYSSRSHTIFRMIIESREKIEDGNIANSCDAVRVSVLNLVDLAGSERAAKTGAEGMRLKEGSHINKSLMTLGSVIKKLSEGAESQGGHVPYRDSKLTRILQPALGGNANTAIICNITLAQVHTDETRSSLQFASRALRVKNCAFVNEILTDAALLKRQRKEIEELRAKLLASHSEHREEEILNLRNTLLQSELEKERIALELEEEKKAKAQRDRRLIEQANKIANLSSLVLCSERNEKNSYLIKNKRRVTWCPGPFSQKCASETYTPGQVATIRDPVRDEQDKGLPLPFEELMQESEAVAEGGDNETGLPDNSEICDKYDDFSLPDAQVLLHVTSRRKMNRNRTGSPLGSNESATNQSSYEDQFSEYNSQSKAKDAESVESECTPSRMKISSSICASSCGHKGLTMRESEAIVVIKQLEDQIKSLEMEKAAIQRDLDNVVELATEQNASFREKSEELHKEVATAREEARLVHEQLHSVASIGALSKEFTANSSIELSKEIFGVVSEVNQSVSTVDNFSSVVEDIFQNFSILSEMLLELKSFVYQDTVQFRSIISGHKKIYRCMRKRIDELELEKDLLQKQFLDRQKQIDELNSDRDKLEKAIAEEGLQHDMEKDELLSQILSFQKEVSCLSSSSLTREKETLRKELDKTKSKLKDTESKLKNTIQDKIRLESEKAQAERELKHLHGQRSLLERDIRKRDSIIDKRHESRPSDLCKTRGIVEHALQDDYNKLEVHAFEMEAEIASLKEALMAAIEEKEETCARVEVLGSELEIMTTKLTTADSEREMLEEEVASMMKCLDESDSFSKKLEASLDLLSREKEEMAMQLTDALLEAEAEKSTWLAREKAFTDTCERVKISNDEIVRLSEDLSEVTCQLESCREESRMLRERLDHSEENAEREKECRMAETSKITQVVNEHNQSTVNRTECSDIKSNFELLSLEHCRTCEEMQKLQENLSALTQERDRFSLQVNKVDIEANLLMDYQNLENRLLMMANERDDLLSKIDDLQRVTAEAEITRKKYEDLLSNARSDVEELAQRVSGMKVKMHNEALEHNKEKTKLRMRLRSTQAKLDAFRGRCKDLVDELGLMNRSFEEASTKLKEQLVSYGHEILRLKKQLTTKE